MMKFQIRETKTGNKMKPKDLRCSNNHKVAELHMEKVVIIKCHSCKKFVRLNVSDF